jgi:DNA-binding PadR family transcriptional regulator
MALPPSGPARLQRDAEAFLPLGTPIFHILLALGGDVLHGYAIQRRFEEESGGEQILPGTLYSSIGRMREWGLVEEVRERPAEDDPRRRYYRATALGRAAAAAEAARMERLVAFARRQALTDER